MLQIGVCRVCFVLAFLALSFGSGCTHRLVRNLEEFRAAKKAGDYELASQYITDDARIWWTKKEGPGSPLTAKGGPYRHWDKEFRGQTTRGDVWVEDNTALFRTTNHNLRSERSSRKVWAKCKR